VSTVFWRGLLYTIIIEKIIHRAVFWAHADQQVLARAWHSCSIGLFQ
jgi:hypothetical protein